LVLTALVLFCCSTVSGDASQPPVPRLSVEISPTTIATPVVKESSSRPDAPTPKSAISSEVRSDFDFSMAGEPSAPAVQPALLSPVKPATTESYETPRQRKIWYGLLVASHGAAAFDAWTTRRAVTGGYGVEGDPFQRPFANSGAIYATTQVTPIVMDYLGHRMMRSSHSWIRKAWWVPQAASASVSFGAGMHNYGMVP